MSRIINRQRQLAEQGRLRLGYTVGTTRKDGSAGTRPVRSETWIVTSHSRDHVERAAELWGGKVEHWEPMGNGAQQWRVITDAHTIPAILPPGDPLSQSYEQWNKGGCVRRCSGVTEELSGSPCICLAQYGEQWYERGPREVCSSKSRLKVLLPDMDGLGSWRMETGSYYATDEIAGMVDTIRGAVGESVLVPVTLRIEQRTRVAGGETKHFVVPVVDLRGVTAGALLSGEAARSGGMQIAAPVDGKDGPAAIESSTPAPQEPSLQPPTPEQIAAVADLDALRAMWTWVNDNGLLTDDLKAALTARATEINSPTAEPTANADGTYDAEVVEDQPAVPADDDADAVWQRILATAGEQGMGESDLHDDFARVMGGMLPDDATAGELSHYLNDLTGRAAA